MNHPEIDTGFFATVSRMKYIDRWALMRNSREESLSEHSLEVGMIAHALCVIGNRRYGRKLDCDRAAVIGMYHDAAEIITGDLPTPVKYYNDEIREAYKKIEDAAETRLLSLLPEDLREDFREIFQGPGRNDPEAEKNEQYLRRLVKAADKLSALIKCMSEEQAGNTEFMTARDTTEKAVRALAAELPEVKDFTEEFLPAYGKTLDELTGRK